MGMCQTLSPFPIPYRILYEQWGAGQLELLGVSSPSDSTIPHMFFGHFLDMTREIRFLIAFLGWRDSSWNETGVIFQPYMYSMGLSSRYRGFKCETIFRCADTLETRRWWICIGCRFESCWALWKRIFFLDDWMDLGVCTGQLMVLFVRMSSQQFSLAFNFCITQGIQNRKPWVQARNWFEGSVHPSYPLVMTNIVT